MNPLVWLLAALGIGALFVERGGLSSAPHTVTTVAGHKYRFTLLAKPPISADDTAKLQAAATLAGSTNVSLSSSSTQTTVQYDTPAVPTTETYTIGSQTSIGGTTLTLLGITELST